MVLIRQQQRNVLEIKSKLNEFNDFLSTFGNFNFKLLDVIYFGGFYLLKNIMARF